MRTGGSWLDKILGRRTFASEEPTDGSSEARYRAAFSEGSEIIQRYIVLTDRHAQRLNPSEMRRGLSLLDQALEIRPDAWQAWWLKGKAFQALGDTRLSFDSFRQAFKINPNEQAVINEMTIASMELGEFDFTLEAVQQGLNVFPNDIALRTRLALALLLSGQVSEAILASDRAVELDPLDPIAMSVARIALEVRDGMRAQPHSMRDLHG